MSKQADSNHVLVFLLTGAALVFVLLALATGYPGQVIIPLVKALWLAGGVFIYGFFLCRLFNRGKEEIDFSTAFALGLMFTTLFFYLAAMFKLLVPAVILLFYAIPLVLLVFLPRKNRGSGLQDMHDTVKSFLNRSPLEYLVFSLPFVYALLPPSFYDTLVYHLGIPNLYLQHSGFIETPQFVYANTSIYYEISLIPAVYAGEIVPRLFHFVCGVIFLFSVVDFAQEVLAVKKRRFLLLLLVSIPMSVFLLSTVKNDLPGAFFVFLGVRYLLKRRFVLSALFWGFAIGVKYINGLFLLIFLVIFVIRESRGENTGASLEKGMVGERPVLTGMIKRLAIFAAVIAVVVLPLLVKNYIYAKNPVFPFFSQFFNSEYWDASRYAIMKGDVGKMFYSWMDVIQFPYRVSFTEIGSGGQVGIQFLVFLPFLLVNRERVKGKYDLFLFAILALFLGGYFTGSSRFLYIAFVIFSIYLGLAVESLEKFAAVSRRLVKILLGIVLALNFLFALGTQERIYRSFQLFSGKLDIEAYKASQFPAYPGFAFVNAHAEPGARVLVAGEARNYYLKRPYLVSTGLDYAIVKKYLRAAENGKAFIAALKKDNIAYLILDLGELNRLQRQYRVLDGREWEKMALFLGDLQSLMVFRQNGIFVFKLAQEK